MNISVENSPVIYNNNRNSNNNNQPRNPSSKSASVKNSPKLMNIPGSIESLSKIKSDEKNHNTIISDDINDSKNPSTQINENLAGEPIPTQYIGFKSTKNFRGASFSSSSSGSSSYSSDPELLETLREYKTKDQLFQEEEQRNRHGNSAPSNDNNNNNYSHISSSHEIQEQTVKNDFNEAAKVQSANNGKVETPTVKSKITNDNGQPRVLPRNFIDCSRDDLIVLVARMLVSLISINDNLSPQISSHHLTRFHSRAPPNISVFSYLTRLAHYSTLENAILITAIYYIDLLSLSYPTFLINSLTVHRFLLTASTVASKGLCDSFCSNNHYAKVGGVHITELNLLEMEFLNKVNWRVIPRDLNGLDKRGSVSTKSSSTNTSTFNENNSIKREKSGVGSAKDVLDLYYRRMIALVGKNVDGDTDEIGNGYTYILDDLPGSNSGSEESIRQYSQLQEEEFKCPPVFIPTSSQASSKNHHNVDSTNSIKNNCQSPLKRAADQNDRDFQHTRGKRRTEKMIGKHN
ncbi:hypothetical protein PACTADRAFT_51458 [Pachysolen tannophilus NRRL Y-2460]|uniref:Cyclin-like domain-containing protein n=1 Tax=Pachysolen tannophilus NRRL Y-2460 TaxID=669874 RepID=A0A1E4TPL1_PACTA|nr:hypothetical protein PACTADRAFT_51458 [Pachysolen tannophilus NRRL Y-2460]